MIKAQFPAQVWDGLTITDTNQLDDKSPDYVMYDQVVAELIAVQEILISHIGLVDPLQNPGPAQSVLMVDDDGTGFRYRTLRGTGAVTITLDDDEIIISATGGGGGIFDDTPYMLLDGSRTLTANWDAGSFDIAAATFTSDVATGTAPFTVASTTVVTNLNADMLDGYHVTDLAAYVSSALGADFVHVDGTSPLTANWDVGGFQLKNLADPTQDQDAATRGWVGAGLTQTLLDATTYTDTAIAGLSSVYAPLVHTHTQYLNKDGSVALTADWDAGDFQIRAKQFYADVATGTAPFIVDSTTVVTNLNADLLDGQHGSYYAIAVHTHTAADITDFSEAVDDRINALWVDGNGITHTYNDASNTFTVALTTLTSDWSAGSARKISAGQFQSQVTTGTQPIIVASTTLVTNLNADKLDGLDASDFAQASTLKETVEDYVAALLIAGSGISLAYTDASSVLLVSVGALTSDWDVGDFQIRAKQFYADVATGTAPFVVTSTTAVTNLNADKVDGKDSTDLILRDGSQAFTANQSMGSHKLTSVATATADGDAVDYKFLRQNTINTIAGSSVLNWPVYLENWASSLPADQGVTLSIRNGLMTQVNNGRLSLSSTDPVEMDSTESATVYFHPAYGNRVALYDTTNNRWEDHAFDKISLSVALLASGVWDIFAVFSGGAVTLETAAWTNTTTRATAITTQDGVPVKNSDKTRRLIGTIYVVSGKVKDDPANRNLANVDNTIRKQLYYFDNTSNTYSGVARIWRNLSNDAFVSFVQPLTNAYLIGSYATIGNSAAGSTFVGFSPIDGSTSIALEGQLFYNQTGTIRAGTGPWTFAASPGRHFHYLMQVGNANSVFQVGALMGQVFV